jgi:ribosomal protein S19
MENNNDELRDRLEQLEQRLLRLEEDNGHQNTMLVAQDQALAAMQQSGKNREMVKLVDRKLNFFACFVTAALLIYYGTNHKELEIARLLVGAAIACGGYGLLVITQREDLITQILPFTRK